jgi:energy-coupling factor transporter transmembrane protein EcfT
VHIGRIDASATLGESWLHRVAPVSKLVAFASRPRCGDHELERARGGLAALALVAVAVSARLDGRLLLTLAGYPAVFALIFAFSAATSMLGGATIVLKAVTAALGAVIVILTTPYPYVFAPIQRIVPSIVGDALLMTYRSLFLLLEKFGNLLTAARLRAGLSAGHPVRAARATTRALGGLLIYSFDLSQRSYDIMRMRGYEGRLRVTLPKSAAPALDALLITGAVALLAVSLTWRFGWQALNPYSWVLPIIPALALAGALLKRGRTA